MPSTVFAARANHAFLDSRAVRCAVRFVNVLSLPPVTRY